MGWFETAKETYPELENWLIKWRKKTLDEAISAGLTWWDRKVPQELMNVDMRINVRVDNMIISCLRSVMRAYPTISKGNISKIITKHGMAIVEHELGRVSKLVGLYDEILSIVDKYDPDLATKFIFDFKFFAREEYIYKEVITIRPVWWVYAGTNKISLLSNISKSDLVRYYLLASLATRFNMLEKRKSYYTNCVTKEIYNIANAMVTMCRHVGMWAESDMKNEILNVINKFEKHDSDLCKELKFLLER